MANTVRNRPDVEKNIVEDVNSNPLENIQDSYEKYKKPINTGLGVVVVLIMAYFAYTKMYQAPREEKASSAIAFAQRYFQVDSLDRALNGDGQHSGFLKVIKKFSGTNAANISNYYAGICYLHMGDYNNAIKYLKDFDGKGTLVAYQGWGALGDAYMETNNIKKGIEYYKKASSNKEDELVTPTYLYRLGVAYEADNQPEEAKKAYKELKEKYPRSMDARDIDKSLARLGELN